MAWDEGLAVFCGGAIGAIGFVAAFVEMAVEDVFIGFAEEGEEEFEVFFGKGYGHFGEAVELVGF